MSDRSLNKLDFSRIKSIYFLRIAGTGMGSCALLAKEMGFHVLGGDSLFYPPMSEALKKANIELDDYTKISSSLEDSIQTKEWIERVKQVDLIVVGNVVSKNSFFADILTTLNVPYLSFPEFLYELVLKKREVLGIAGTHGKSTTSYLLSQMLHTLGFSHGQFIGAVLPKDLPSAILGCENDDQFLKENIEGSKKKSFFVIEADEYDSSFFLKKSKFHFYGIQGLLITSLEFDHADIFSSVDDIWKEFIDLILSSSVKLIVYEESLEEELKKRLTHNGYKNNLKSKKFVSYSGKNKRFCAQYCDLKVLNHLEKHNQENLEGALTLLNEYGLLKRDFKFQDIFLLPKRRQEIRGSIASNLLIDDFAHHPTAIKKTLKSLKEKYVGHQLRLIYEPASQTARSNIYFDQYLNCFAEVDSLCFIVPKKTNVLSSTTLDLNKLVLLLNEKGMNTCIVETQQELLSYFFKIIKGDEKKLIVFMSNSSVLGIWDVLLDYVEKNN